MRAYSGDGLPIVRIGGQHRGDVAEASKESTRRNRGNSRNGCEHRLGCWAPWIGFRTLSVRRSSSGWRVFSSLRKSVKPERGVRRVARPKYCDAEVNYRETCAADRGWRKRSTVKIGPLDEQIWKTGRFTKPTELGPKRAPHNCKVHSANGLSFDDGAARQVVIATAEAGDAHTDSMFFQQPWHPTRPLMSIGKDQHGAASVPASRCPERGVFVPVRPLALSQGESA